MEIERDHIGPNDCLRPLTLDDLDMMRAWRNHPSVSDYMLTKHEISAAEHLAWFESSSRNQNRKLCIFEHQNIASGFVSFDINPIENEAEWGFYLAPSAEKGIGCALGEAALKQAFELYNLSLVIGKVIPTNQKSINFHLRLGFHREARLTTEISIDEANPEQIIFKLSDINWLKARGD
jgi:UDP-4-amino-4,6-dideoxy-N-acetyl-beta-L-altrosamine N-acetyltransferase